MSEPLSEEEEIAAILEGEDVLDYSQVPGGVIIEGYRKAYPPEEAYPEDPPVAGTLPA